MLETVWLKIRLTSLIRVIDSNVALVRLMPIKSKYARIDVLMFAFDSFDTTILGGE